MAKEKTTPTYVLVETHKQVGAFAKLKGVGIPEAYEILATEGLKALHIQLPKV